MWYIWDRTVDLNGFSADFILNRNKHLNDEKAIYVCEEDGRIFRIEGKSVLAKIYNIDANLSDEDFLFVLEEKWNKLINGGNNV